MKVHGIYDWSQPLDTEKTGSVFIRSRKKNRLLMHLSPFFPLNENFSETVRMIIIKFTTVILKRMVLLCAQ